MPSRSPIDSKRLFDRRPRSKVEWVRKKIKQCLITCYIASEDVKAPSHFGSCCSKFSMEKVAVSPDAEEPCEKDEFQNILETLPLERVGYDDLYLYQGCWYPSTCIKSVISFQRHFQALDSDVIIASIPKSGTTWLKALTFSILNRTRYTTLKDSPLLTSNPHQLIPSFEFILYKKSQSPDLLNLPCPRIFATHTPYPSLPHSIKDSNCRIVYVCRNILDQFISLLYFAQKSPRVNMEQISLDDEFNKYCRGVHAFGPFADHALGYWKASLDRPEKVLFLKYEDMKEDIHSQAKRLANFMGCPFSVEEENQGVEEEICGFCSFESLKNLEVNKTGLNTYGVPYAAFYRNGKVGDWENHLSASQAEYLENLVEEKLRGSGLTLKISAGFPKGG